MPIFNKREVGYIKAIAGVGKHKTFVHKRWFGNLAQNGVQLTELDYVNASGGNSRLAYKTSQASGVELKKLHVFGMALHKAHVAVDAADTSAVIANWSINSNKLACGLTSNSSNGTGTSGTMVELDSLTCKAVAEADDGKIDESGNVTTGTQVTPTTIRVGSEFFLDKTTYKFRFTMPDFGTTSNSNQPHFEYRLIMFRNRKPVKSYYAQDNNAVGCSFLNFQYDLFNGPVGRPVGFRGWRGRMDFDGHENYRGMTSSVNKTWSLPSTETDIAEPGAPEKFTTDEWMTMPLNSADYIILKDERFFLGTEHGKSHYEMMMPFNWREQGETLEEDLTTGLREGFNPNIYFLLMGTSNDAITPNLNMMISATTTIESA